MTDAELALVEAIVAQLREGVPLHEIAAGVDPTLLELAVTITGELAESGTFFAGALPGFDAVWQGVAALGGIGASAAAAGAAGTGGGAAGGGSAGGAGGAGGGAAGGGAAGGVGSGAAGVAGTAGAAGAAGAAGGIAGAGGILGAIGGVLGSATGVLAAAVGAAVVGGAILTAVLITGGEDDAPDIIAGEDVDGDDLAEQPPIDAGPPAEDSPGPDDVPSSDQPPAEPEGDADPALSGPLSDAPPAPAPPTVPAPTPPVEPTPGDPEPPTEPESPTEPGPTDPTVPGPVDPVPVDPGPVDPGPVGPDPTGPTDPTVPGPVDPGPVDPGPVDPVPGPVPPSVGDAAATIGYGDRFERTAGELVTSLAVIPGTDAIDPASLVVVAPVPSGGTAVIQGTLLVYTPNNDHTGQDTFGYRLCDTAGRCDEGVLTITTSTPPAPDVTDIVATTDQDVGITLDLRAAIDVTGGAPLAAVDGIRIGSGPTSGSLTALADDGATTYTPSEGFAGTDSFTFWACDLLLAQQCTQGTASITVVEPPPPPIVSESVRINFGPAAGPTPSGYLGDSGTAFAFRGGGLSFGWRALSSREPLDLSANTRARGLNPDGRYDTLIHLQYGDVPGGADGVSTEGMWELDVPNGAYWVTVAVGDPEVWQEPEAHSIRLEGATVIDRFVPAGAAGSLDRHRTVMARVEVADGALTVDALGGTNTKLNWIEVVPIGLELELTLAGGGTRLLQLGALVPGIDAGSVELLAGSPGTLTRSGTSTNFLYEAPAGQTTPFDIRIGFRGADGFERVLRITFTS